MVKRVSEQAAAMTARPIRVRSELARHRCWCDVQPCDQVGPAPAVEVELAALQGAQQGLLRGAEEVQSLDGRGGTDARLTRPLQIMLACAGVVQAGQERQVALVAPKASRTAITDRRRTPA
jgi:hypothetical protein